MSRLREVTTFIVLVLIVLIAFSSDQSAKIVPYVEISERDVACLDALQPGNIADNASWYRQQFRIDDEAAYRRLLKYKRPDKWCSDFRLPEINFSAHTLLGRHVFLSECESPYVKKAVLRDDTKRIYTYRLTITEHSAVCSGPGFVSKNWVIVPKVEASYDVVFDIE